MGSYSNSVNSYYYLLGSGLRHRPSLQQHIHFLNDKLDIINRCNSVAKESLNYLCYHNEIIHIKFPARFHLPDEVLGELAIVGLQREGEERLVEFEAWSKEDLEAFLKFEHLPYEEFKELEISGKEFLDLPQPVIDIFRPVVQNKLMHSINKIKWASGAIKSFSDVEILLSALKDISFQRPTEMKIATRQSEKIEGKKPLKEMFCQISNQKDFTVMIYISPSEVQSGGLFELRYALTVDEPEERKIYLLNQGSVAWLKDCVPQPFKDNQKYAIYNQFQGESVFLFELIVHFRRM